MKILVLYASKYGCAEDCANYLKDRLGQEATIINLKSIGNIDLRQYDWIVIGGSVYVGKIQKEVRLFCRKNLQTLLEKNIALFICCTTPGQTGEFFKNNFPDQLQKHAMMAVNFGGELRQHKMGFFDKKLTALVSKLEPKKNEILYKNIEQLAEAINKKNQ